MAGGDLQIVDKSVDGSPDLQTEADRRAQYCIVQSLQKRFSSLKIVGEEVSFVLFLYTLVIFQDTTSVCPELEESFDKGPLLINCTDELREIKEEEVEEEENSFYIWFQVVVWVDPLDGTSEVALALKNKDAGWRLFSLSLTLFSALLEQVTVLIGVAYKERAVAGIIHQPYYNKIGRTIWAIEGCGIHGIIPATGNRRSYL